MVKIRKHKFKIIVALLILVIYPIVPKPQIAFLGFYQSDGPVNGYYVQLSVWQRDHKFSLYIDNREVASGSYKQLDDNTYELLGDKQTFSIELDRSNSFELIINKLNDGKPIRLNNIGHTPMHFSGEFLDVEEYKELLSNI